MAATTSFRSRIKYPTIGILYGFCEGSRIGNLFEHAIVAGGFSIERDITRADIIVSHSGGCFAVPPQNTAKMILLIGLPYAPGKPMIASLAQKVWLDYRSFGTSRSAFSLARKTFWNFVYFWRLPNNFRMLAGIHNKNWQSLQNVVLIRNKQDVMCTVPTEKIPFEHKPKVVHLPGHHDDCWLHPQKYVDIIKIHYGT